MTENLSSIKPCTIKLSDIDMMIGASMDSIAMVEGERDFRSRNA
jgi:hypothetical protein